MFPMQGQPMQGNVFMPMFPNGNMPYGVRGGQAAYDPHEARMDMRPSGSTDMSARSLRPPVLPRVRGENGDPQILHPPLSGELPVIQDLTPREAKNDASLPANGDTPGKPGPSKETMPNGVGNPMPGQLTSQMSMDIDMAVDGPIAGGTVGPQARGLRPMRGGRGVGRPGFFNGDVQRFRPERRNDKTLVVEKIPDDKLSLETVNEWFKKFGTVTNVAIDASSAKALVSFSTHEEAHAAWKSEDAVFNNRFVKIFWHRPMEGQGQVGQRMLAASGALVANMSKEATPSSSISKPAPSATQPATQPSSTPSIVVHSRKPSVASTSTASALAAKQQLLEQQISEQKSLMEQLGSASPEEKKVILARLRKLGEEMKPVPSSTAPTTPSNARRRTSSTPRPDDIEQKERERLDKELEIHSATLAADGEAESTDALQAKLAKLKAEVCQHHS